MRVQKVLLLVLISFPVSLAAFPDLSPAVVSVSHRGPSQIHVSWGPLQPAQVLKYIVEYGVIPYGGIYTMTLQSQQCSTILNDLDQGTEYLITVTAVYVNGQERAMSVKARTNKGMLLVEHTSQYAVMSYEFGSCFRYIRCWGPKVLHLLSSHPIPSFKNSHSVNSFFENHHFKMFEIPLPVLYNCFSLMQLYLPWLTSSWPCCSIRMFRYHGKPIKKTWKVTGWHGSEKTPSAPPQSPPTSLSACPLQPAQQLSHALHLTVVCVCLQSTAQVGEMGYAALQRGPQGVSQIISPNSFKKKIKASVASCFSDSPLWLSLMTEINNQYESEAARAKNGLNWAF